VAAEGTLVPVGLPSTLDLGEHQVLEASEVPSDGLSKKQKTVLPGSADQAAAAEQPRPTQ
jgi:hypothetical protein